MRWTFLLCLLAGCPNTIPDEPDAPLDVAADDAPSDVPSDDVPGDAGPCGGACSDPAPFCVEDACVACRTDADCVDPFAPRCAAGACESCLGRTDCSGPMVAAEVEARWCQAIAGAPPTRDPSEDELQQRGTEASVIALVCGRIGTGSLAPIFDAIREGRTTVDPEQLEACRQGIALLGPRYGVPAVETCVDLYQGLLPDGTGCIADFECGSGYCARAAGCDGICTARGGLLASCTTDRECASGLICSLGACREPPTTTVGAIGDPCTRSADCDPLIPLRCGASRMCQPYPAAGEGCSTATLIPCAPGLFCDTSSVCRSRIAPGMPCTDVVSCEAGTRCAGVPATCRRMSTVDGPCGTDLVCPDGTSCTSGRCARLPDVGEPCTDACYRGVCTGGTCTSQMPGVACRPGSRSFDALDPCGAGATCLRGSGAWECTATVGVGATCSSSIPCDEPDSFCDGGSCGRPCAL